RLRAVLGALPGDHEAAVAADRQARTGLHVREVGVDLDFAAECEAGAREPSREDAVARAVLCAVGAPADDEVPAAPRRDRGATLIRDGVEVDLELTPERRSGARKAAGEHPGEVGVLPSDRTGAE